jgi:predicted acylesterase/phospholipase RssA
MTITSICLSGGGPSLLKQLGAIQILEQNNFWKIENIQSIFATSAGAWLSIILLLKIEWQVINDYVIKRPWHEAINMSPFQLFHIYDDKGVFDIDLVIIFFKPLFFSKNITLEITMKEFYDITKTELFFYTFEINEFKCVELSHKSHPNLKLLDALYMTSCIPLLFKPYIENETHNNNQNENDRLVITKCYIDGGISANYPLEYCLKHNKNPDEILSFKNLFENNITDKIINEKTDTIDFVTIFIHKLLKMLDTQDDKETINNEVLCKNSHITLKYLTDIIYSEELRNNILIDGFDIGKKYLHNILYKG